MQELDVPDESFSLIKKTEQELVQAFRGVGPERRKSISNWLRKESSSQSKMSTKWFNEESGSESLKLLLVTEVKTNIGGRGSLTVTSGYSATA